MGFLRSLFLFGLLLLLITTSSAISPRNDGKDHSKDFSADVDNDTYIDANNILMFVTNHGNYGRDLAGTFGYGRGTFYPLVDTQSISKGSGALSVLFAAGLWLGGINQNGDTLVAISDYGSEHVPGPMAGGTFQADRAEFRDYKLFRDSLESNPNNDYLNWPVDQGAPVDSAGKPLMKGDQMLWTVFNDADPNAHTEGAGETAPMGIEVQMTVWAFDSVGDFEFDVIKALGVSRSGRELTTPGEVTVYVVEPENLTGHDYTVLFEEIAPGEIVWHLVDATTSDTVLFDQTNQSGDDNYAIVDGLQVKVIAPPAQLLSVEEVHDGIGVVDPSDNVFRSLNSTGDWFIHSYWEYDEILTLDLNGIIGTDDWEMRFTSGGSHFYRFQGGGVELETERAPLEVWNIGTGAPNDPADDRRVFFNISDKDASGDWSWGDRHYFWIHDYVEPPPVNPTWDADNDLILGYITFRDSSSSLDIPAEGTIIRFSTLNELTNTPADTFTFTGPSILSAVTGGEGNAIYIQYKLYNRGVNNFAEFFTGFFADPDLGDANDDLVGCDTLSSVFFCYNADNDDEDYYGTLPPACGFRLLAGPIIASAGDSALFGDQWISDSRNLGMTSFMHIVQGNFPDRVKYTYGLLSGLNWYAQPYVYMGQQLNFMFSGDPVSAQGDLDEFPYDRRMIAATGPVTFNSGDSQYVLLKFAVGHGDNRLESITKLREILGYPDIVLDAPNDPNNLPDEFSLSVNYPNPFNPSTTIEYSLPLKSEVALAVFNILGRQVKTLVDGTESPGRHTARWDGRNEKNEPVASGIYFYRLRADHFSQTRKMILLK